MAHRTTCQKTKCRPLQHHWTSDNVGNEISIQATCITKTLAEISVHPSEHWMKTKWRWNIGKPKILNCETQLILPNNRLHLKWLRTKSALKIIELYNPAKLLHILMYHFAETASWLIGLYILPKKKKKSNNHLILNPSKLPMLCWEDDWKPSSEQKIWISY